MSWEENTCGEIKNKIKWGDDSYYAIRKRNGKLVTVLTNWD
jgi:hypothetical protein